MGSLLSIAGSRVWISPRALFNGGFGKLRLGQGDREVAAVGLHVTYGPLVARLAANRDVYLFPYDWRRSVGDAARCSTGSSAPRCSSRGSPDQCTSSPTRWAGSSPARSSPSSR